MDLVFRQTEFVRLWSSVVVHTPHQIEHDHMPLHLETILLRLKTVVVIGILVRNRLHNLLLQLIVAVYHRRLRRFLVLMADVVRGQPGHVFVQLTELPLSVVRVQLRLQR